MAAERPPFERTALILQGGGALGSYQAGVYQALAEANLHPDWGRRHFDRRGELGPDRRGLQPRLVHGVARDGLGETNHD